MSESTTVVERLINLSEVIDPSTAAWQTSKRLLFWTHALQSTLDCSSSPASQGRSVLSYLFEELGFQTEPSRSDTLCLDIAQVIRDRKGHPLTIGLLACHLAASKNISLLPLEHPRFHLLKSCQDEHSVFFDLGNRGQTVCHSEILSALQEAKESSALEGALEVMSIERMELHYLSHMRRALVLESRTRALISVYSAILERNPKRVDILCDRAEAFVELGMLEDAERDLKRFFAFTEPHNRPPRALNLLEQISGVTSRV